MSSSKNTDAPARGLGTESDPASIEDAARALQRGELVAFPTETVYGLGADAANPEAVSKIFTLKQRPANHPLIVHIGDPDHLHHWGRDIPKTAEKLMAEFWPGPLTLIVRRGLTPMAVTGGQDSVGIRMPSHPVALALLRQFGGAVAAPSANRFGRISPTQSRHVREEFGANLETILEGGACAVGLESTIVSLIESQPRLLRPGHISRTALETVLGTQIMEGPSAESTLRASGLLASHYAPETPMRLVDAPLARDWIEASPIPKHKIAFLALNDSLAVPPAACHTVAMPGDPEHYGQQIYATLRALDGPAFDLIIVEKPPQTEAWQAINDRLTRASHVD